MYSFNGRIRYSESDSTGKLSLEGLMNYFQDCSTFHSEDLGVGMGYLKAKNLIWVLSSWQIVIRRYPELCETVEVGTFPYAFKGCFGHRNFFLKDAQGTFLAMANTMWTLLNTETMRPAVPSEEMTGKYTLEEKLPMEYAPRKIPVPAGGIRREAFAVRGQHLDTNNHVNNVQYVRMAMDYLPEEFTIGQMRAEYKKQARLHDVLYPCITGEGTGYVVSLQDEQGGVYVTVEFLSV